MAEKHTKNFLRLVALVWSHGTAAARRRLTKCYRAQGEVSLKSWLLSKNKDITSDVRWRGASGNKPLFPNQYDVLFPSDPFREDVNEKDLDLTLTSYLLTRFCGSYLSSEGRRAMANMRQLRNKLAHWNDATMDHQTFELMWANIVGTINILDPESPYDFYHIKNELLDEEKVQEYKRKMEEQEKRELNMGIFLEEKLEKLETVEENTSLIPQLAKDVSQIKKDMSVNKGNNSTFETNNQTNAFSSDPLFDFEEGDLKQKDLELILTCHLPNKSIVVYKKLPEMCKLFLDILSLWNTPDRAKSYILIGIKSSNHLEKAEVLGIDEDETFPIEIPFMNEEYLQSVPQFLSYKMVFKNKNTAESKHIGVFEILSSQNVNSPPAMLKKEVTFGGDPIKKGLIWIRIGNTNKVIEICDAMYRRMIEWFNYDQENMISIEDEEKLESMHSEEFCQSMDHFRSGRGHGFYILITDKINLEQEQYRKSLTKVPWILVLDFDIDSFKSGFHSCFRSYQQKRLENKTWNDKNIKLDEEFVNWVFMLGVKFDSEYTSGHSKWAKDCKDCLLKITEEIKNFSKDGNIKILVIWNENTSKVYKFLEKLLNFFDSHLLHCPRSIELIACSKYPLPILEDLSLENYYFNLDVTNVLANIRKETATKNNSLTGYLLPVRDKSKFNNPMLTTEDTLWIAETLDVLYLETNHEQALCYEERNKIEIEFLKGAGITWSAWQRLGDCSFAIQRVWFDKIETELLSLMESETGTVEIVHSPGAGCTTLAMQLLWNMHRKYPCAQVKPNQFDKSYPELAELLAQKISLLCKKTDYPVLLFLDEPEKTLLEELPKVIKPLSCVFLTTNRNIATNKSKMTFKEPGKKVRFEIKGILEQSESGRMINKLSTVAPEKNKELKKLSNSSSMLIEFSLTAFVNEFKGLESYVQNVYNNLENKHKAVCKYLSFVDVFSNSGFRDLKTQIFYDKSLLEKVDSNKELNSNMLLEEPLLQYLVKPSNNSRKIKMIHYLFSEKILQFYLRNYNDDTTDCSYPKLHVLAKEFINFITEGKDEMDSDDKWLLTQIFLERPVTKSETKGETPKYTYTYVIMSIEESTEEATIQRRQEVFEKLSEKLHSDPHTHAHLGRFYYLSAKSYEKAISSFDKAVQLVREAIDSPIRTKDSTHFSSARIVYQMYAMMDFSLMKNMSRNLDTNKDVKMEEFITVIRRGCRHFKMSREYTKSDNDHYFLTYLSEVYFRLKYCHILHFKNIFDLKNIPLRIGPDKKSWEKDAADIVNESFELIDGLIMRASTCIEESNSSADKEVQEANCQYKSLFGSIDTRQFGDDTIFSRRMKVAAIKLRYLNEKADKPIQSDIFGSLRNVTGEDLKTSVKLLECNITEAIQSSEKIVSDRRFENDLTEWLTGIRLNNFLEDYKLEHVLKVLEQSNRAYRSPIVMFYTAILRFLIGVGSSKKEGDLDMISSSAQLMKELKEERRRKGSTFSKHENIREWLGKRGGIKRLQPSFRGEPLNVEELNSCYGFIKSPNEYRHSGLISLEKIGNKRLIKPLDVYLSFRQKGKQMPLSGSRFAFKRVSFFLSFSMTNGFEARDEQLCQ